jgi:hypothetical protein
MRSKNETEGKQEMDREFQSTIRAHVHAWGMHNVHFGTWSWTALPWRELLGLRRDGVTREGVLGALAAYGRIFRTVAVPASALESFPPPVVARWGDLVPPDFRFLVVVENGITTYRFPYGYPDRAKRGQTSPDFCDAEQFARSLLPLLKHLTPHLENVLFRFAPIYATEELSARAFAGRLENLLKTCPAQYHYAVEVDAGMESPFCTACLREHGAARALGEQHCRPLLEQVLLPDLLTAARLFLRIPARASWLRGEGGLALQEAIRQCVDARVELSVFLEAGLETAGSEAMRCLIDRLTPELARLSPFRRRAA